MDLSIGDLARLSDVSVKTIRFWSDSGLLPECRRTQAGYRRYDARGLARVELIRSLRDLGIDLATIRRIAEQQTSLEEVARVQAAATDAHIRQLTLRRSVLRAIARGTATTEEVQRMSAFARASADEARHIMEEFLAAVFAEHEDDPFAARMRAALPALPEQPSDAQVDAWIELAALVGDPAFRERVRGMVIAGERHRAVAGDDHSAAQAAGARVIEDGGRAVAEGIDPSSPEGRRLIDGLVAGFAGAAGRADDRVYRAELLEQMETFADRRVERYWQLIGIINGWPEHPSSMPAHEWFIGGLRAPLG